MTCRLFTITGKSLTRIDFNPDNGRDARRIYCEKNRSVRVVLIKECGGNLTGREDKGAVLQRPAPFSSFQVSNNGGYAAGAKGH